MATLPKLQDNSNSNFQKISDGLYAYKVTITNIIDESNYVDKITPQMDKKPGLMLRVKYTRQGDNSEKNSIIFGRFKAEWDNISKTIKRYLNEWDNSYYNGVLLFLNNMFNNQNIDILDDNMHIKTEYLKFLFNKEAIMVKYNIGKDESGNNKQELFSFFPVDTSTNDIVSLFNYLKERNVIRKWVSSETAKSSETPFEDEPEKDLPF